MLIDLCHFLAGKLNKINLHLTPLAEKNETFRMEGYSALKSRNKNSSRGIFHFPFIDPSFGGRGVEERERQRERDQPIRLWILP